MNAMSDKSVSMSFRLSKSEADALEKISKETGVSVSTLARALINGLIDYYDSTGSLELTLGVVPKKSERQ
jgi:hypothetical protein